MGIEIPPDEKDGQPDAALNWAHRHLGDQNFRTADGFLSWWHNFTAPPPAPAGASFEQRDLVRRGRIASTIMLCLGIIMPLVGIIGLIGPNKQIFFTALIVVAIIALCCFLNRKGRVNTAGVIFCLAINAGMYMSILRAPGGLSPNDKDILYLLIFAELIIGAILPANWIFVAAVGNFLFCYAILTFGPHTTALDAMLATSYPTLLSRLFQIHAIPTAVVWSLATLAREAAKRADRAEEVARLEHTVSQMKNEKAETATVLETQVEQIITTLNLVSQGQADARVPLNQGTLWPLVGKINNLLSRYQRALQGERQTQAMNQTLHAVNDELIAMNAAVQQAVQTQQPLQLPPQLNKLEPVFRHLNGKYILPSKTTNVIQ